MKTLTYLELNMLLTFIVMLCFVNSTNAQSENVLRLSMLEVSEMATQNNWQVQKATQILGMATSELKASNATFLPSINLSETYTTTTDPLMAFGTKLQQQITTNSDFNPVLLNDPGATDNFKTRIYVEQPIFNLDGINAKKASSASVQASEFNLRWTRNLIRLQAKNLYFMLQLSYEKKEAIESALESAMANYQVANDLFDQGLIHNADLLMAKLRVTEIESEKISTKNQVSDINAELTHFLGLNQSVSIYPIDPIADVEIPDDYLKIVEIPETRSDLQSLSSRVKAGNQMIKSSRGGLMPRLNAFGSYEWNDSNLFGTAANNYLLGARLEWDIFKGGRNLAKVQKATYEKNIAEISYKEKLSEGQRELEKIHSKIILAQKQIELSNLTLEQAEEAYRVRVDRFQEGLERTADVLLSESYLLTKRINHLESLSRLQQLVFNLEMLLEKESTI